MLWSWYPSFFVGASPLIQIGLFGAIWTTAALAIERAANVRDPVTSTTVACLLSFLVIVATIGYNVPHFMAYT